MARRYRTHVREEKAVEFKVDITTGLEDYKDAWLIINNTAKTDKESIYKVYNDYNDGIYVLCNPEVSKNLGDFLSQFGEVTRNDDRVAVFVDVECDYSNFDKDYIDSEYILGETD